MNIRLLACALLAAFAGLAKPAATSTEYSDAATLAAELRRLEQSSAPRALPSIWNVKTPDGNYFISTEPLRTLEAKPGSARQWLHARAAELDRYSPNGQTARDAGPALQAILADPEFNIRPKQRTAWDIYRDRFDAWLKNLFQRIFGFLGRSPIGGAAVFWTAFAGAAALLAFWLVTLLRSGITGISLTGGSFRSALGQSEDWIAAMRAASASGDVRKAIQCGYWAGVARLQTSGKLPLGSTRTPREYLRYLASPQTGQPVAALNPLRTLTLLLEEFWYGRRAATPDDFSLCQASLKDLGCRLD